MGMEHINELMVRLAKKLLGDGNRLAFGGTLGDKRQKLTQYLIDATQSWQDGGAAQKNNNAGKMPKRYTTAAGKMPKKIDVCHGLAGPGARPRRPWPCKVEAHGARGPPAAVVVAQS